MHPGDAPEEGAVFRHRVVDPWSGEDALAEEAERGDGDSGSDQRGAGGTDHPLRDIHGGRRALLQAHLPQHPEARDRHAGVQGDHAEDAGDERPGEIAASVLHLAGDEAGGLETAVGKEHGYQRRHEARPALWTVERGRRRPREPDGDQRGDGRDLQHHQRALHASAGSNAQAIDESQDGHHQRREGAFRKPDARELAEVSGEGHRADRHSPRLDHDQERPPVEKSDRRMPGLAQVHVLPASEGPLPGKSGVDERAEQRDDASQKPGADHLRARRGQGSDDGGSNEDAGSDDAAHHHHGGVEQADASRQPFLGHRQRLSWRAGLR